MAHDAFGHSKGTRWLALSIMQFRVYAEPVLHAAACSMQSQLV